MKKFLILLIFTAISNTFVGLQVEASWNYSSNPNDYDFGWFAINGTYPPGSEPYCTYCVNALTYDIIYTPTPADRTHGLYWNLTVGTYRCDGVEPNEFWAYHEPTSTIVFGNLSRVLCIDAADFNVLGVLKLRYCNSSSVSQQWRKNGSQVFSALLGSEGQDLFMVGEFPNKAAKPTNEVYEFPVILNSSMDSNLSSDRGYFFTKEFTFLSSSSLIDKSTNRFTTEGLLQVARNSVGKTVNGGFEDSTIQAGSGVSWSDYTQHIPSYFSLCGWVIDYGPIDYVKSSLLQPAEGSYCVHLNTHSDVDHWGQVSQTIITEIGAQYVLSFSFNGFPPNFSIESRPTWKCSAAYQVAGLQVMVTNSSSTNKSSVAVTPNDAAIEIVEWIFFMNVSNSNGTNFGGLWRRESFSFWALSNVTSISFSSLNFNDSCGPLIDKVALVSS